MSKNIFALGLAAVAVVIATIALVFPNVVAPAPGNTTASYVNAVGGFRVNGTPVFDSSGDLQTGSTCDLNFGNVPSSIAASSTVPVDCQGTNRLATASAAMSAITGIDSSKNVIVQMASSSPTTYLGTWLSGCSASTTSGYATCQFHNGTGAAMTPGTTTTHGAQVIPFE